MAPRSLSRSETIQRSRLVLKNEPIDIVKELRIRRRRENAERRQRINETALVYFIYCDCPDGFIKIGMAEKPLYRLAVLQVANPYPLSLLGTATGGWAREKEVHALFKADCVGGEWFKSSMDLLRFIERERIEPFEDEVVAMPVHGAGG